MTLTDQAPRCPRCAGSGDIPIIAPDAFVYPERKPLLESCPDCGGSGLIRERQAEPERINPEPAKPKRRR